MARSAPSAPQARKVEINNFATNAALKNAQIKHEGSAPMYEIQQTELRKNEAQQNEVVEEVGVRSSVECGGSRRAEGLEREGAGVRLLGRGRARKGEEEVGMRGSVGRGGRRDGEGEGWGESGSRGGAMRASKSQAIPKLGNVD
jgi:hypothetical protein